MRQEEQLKKLSEEIERRRKVFYEKNEETAMEDFFKLKVLCDCYEAITGEAKFSYSELGNNEIFEEDFVVALTDRINSEKNDVVVEEKKKAKKEALFNSGLVNIYSIMENYYKELEEKSNLPEGNYKRWYIDKLILDIPKRYLSEEKIGKVVNMFLENINYKYHDIYNKMREEGKIFFLDGNFQSSTNYGGACNGIDFDYENPYDVIVVKRCDNDLETIVNLVHELAHTIEYLELREKVDKQKFLDFRFTTQYGEITAGIYELKCCDFLEDLGFPSEEVEKVRTKKAMEHMDTLQRFIKDVYSDENTGRNTYTENFNHDLEYVYLVFASLYFANIDEEKFTDTMKKYDEEKINTRGFSIFNKIGCDNETLEKMAVKQLKKCM